MDRISPRMQSWQSWRWILKTFVVVLVVVETQPHRTDLWMSIFAPPDLFSSPFLGFSAYETTPIPSEKKKTTTPSATYIGPKQKNTKPTDLPTYQNPNPFPAKSVFFHSIRFDVEPNSLVCLDEQCMVFSLLKDAVEFIDDYRHIKGGKPRTVRTSSRTRHVTWQVGNGRLVGWLVGWIGLFFWPSKNIIRELGGMCVYFFQRNNWDNYLFFAIIFAKLQWIWRF